VEWLESEEGLAMLAGNSAPAAADPIAMVYGGHQFGGWSSQLGDGRALLVGEVIDTDGNRRDIHLKGSGPTQYSRGGDGKATIGAALREYIVSEGMYALGVPTTRALAVVNTGEVVQRETPMPGAVIARVASSHVRVGTFQYFSARKDVESVRTLADYMVKRHFPEAAETPNAYVAMLAEVITRHAKLVAQWMHLGFIHGVMNTDNSQIVGETIDFGPCAFMDEFHPRTVFSSIDRQGRYAWDNQPAIAQWNLERFAETLLPLLGDTEAKAMAAAEEALGTFPSQFDEAFVSGFLQKFGLEVRAESREFDRDFIGKTLMVMGTNVVDYTLFFRHLTRHAGGQDASALIALFKEEQAAEEWLKVWRERFAADTSDEAERVATMRSVNPIFIPRNHRVDQAIESAVAGNLGPFHKLTKVLERPFEEQPEHAEYEQAPNADEKITETFCGT